MKNEDDRRPDVPDPLQVRLDELFRSHGVAPELARPMLDEAITEVGWRSERPGTEEERLLEAVARRCRRHSEELRRRALETLDGKRGSAGREEGPDGDPKPGA
jgi:hypothetical protein